MTPSSPRGASPDDPSRPRGRAGLTQLHRAEYTWLREQISEHVAGHEHAVRRLALAGARHRMGHRVRPVLLIGAPGTGKTTLATAVAQALGLPTTTIDAAGMAETSWAGVDITDSLGALARKVDDVRRLERITVVLDELDKCAVAGDLSPASRGYRLGKQTSLLSLLGGQMTAIELGHETVSWSASGALVIATGVFHGAEPSRRGLMGYGLIPELVDRFGAIIELGPVSAEALRRMLAADLRASYDAYEAYGYSLRVSDEALRCLAALTVAPDSELSPRSAMALLSEVATEGLLRLLEDAAPEGSVVSLDPDDLAPGRYRLRPRRTR